MMHILSWLLFCLALATEAKSTCRPRDVAQVRKVMSAPIRFCTWYTAVVRNRSPITGLSAARLRDACRCIAPPPQISKPQRRIKGYNSHKSCQALSQVVRSYTKQPQSFCAFWLAAPASDRSRFTSPIKSLTHPMDVYKACRCRGLAKTTTRPVVPAVTTTRSIQSRSTTLQSNKPRTTTRSTSAQMASSSAPPGSSSALSSTLSRSSSAVTGASRTTSQASPGRTSTTAEPSATTTPLPPDSDAFYIFAQDANGKPRRYLTENTGDPLHASGLFAGMSKHASLFTLSPDGQLRSSYSGHQISLCSVLGSAFNAQPYTPIHKDGICSGVASSMTCTLKDDGRIQCSFDDGTPVHSSLLSQESMGDPLYAIVMQRSATLEAVQLYWSSTSIEDPSGQGTPVSQSTSTTISSSSESMSTDTSTTAFVQSSSTTTASQSASTRLRLTPVNNPPEVKYYFSESSGRWPSYYANNNAASTVHLDEDGYLISDTSNSQISVLLNSASGSTDYGLLYNADTFDYYGGVEFRCPLKCSFEASGRVLCTTSCPTISSQTLDTFFYGPQVAGARVLGIGSSGLARPQFTVMWEDYYPDPVQSPAPGPLAKMANPEQLSAVYGLLATGNPIIGDAKEWAVENGSTPNTLSISTLSTTSPDLFSLAGGTNPGNMVDTDQTSPNTLCITEDLSGSGSTEPKLLSMGYGGPGAASPDGHIPVTCTYYVDYSVKCTAVGSNGRIFQYPYMGSNDYGAAAGLQAPYPFGLSAFPITDDNKARYWSELNIVPLVLSLAESTSTNTSTTTSVQSSSTTTALSSASTTASVQSSSTTTASPSASTRLWAKPLNAQGQGSVGYLRESTGAVAMPGLSGQSQASTFHLDEDGYLISDTRRSQLSVGLESASDELGQLINADSWDNGWGPVRCPLKCSFETNGEVPCTAICPDGNQTLDTFSIYVAVYGSRWIRFGSSTVDTESYPTFKMMWESYLPDPPQAPAPDPPAKMTAQQLSAAYTLLATGNTMFDNGQQWVVSSGSTPNTLSIATTSPDLFSLASGSNPDFTVDNNQTSPNTLRITTPDPSANDARFALIGYGGAEALDPDTRVGLVPVKCTYYVDYSVKCIVVGPGGRIYQYPYVVPGSQPPYAFGLSPIPLTPEGANVNYDPTTSQPFVLSLGPPPCTSECG